MQAFSCENELNFHENEPAGETYFHMNGFDTEANDNSEKGYY